MRSDSYVLGFDTAAAHCAAALLCGDRNVASRIEPMAKGQAERLMPLLQDVLADAGISWSDLAAIGVGIGPGNFTGIRISVSAARGLALALGIPAIGVTAFEALAFGIERPVLALVDARRDQVYAQHMGRDANAAPEIIAAPTRLMDTVVVGFGADKPTVPVAEAIARIAAGQLPGTDLPRPAPLYVRSADAAPAREHAPRMLP